MVKKYTLSPQVQVPTVAKKILEEEQRQLAEFKPQTVLGREDSGIHAHKPVAADASFHDKIYIFPESYNALRQEIYNYWPNLWSQVAWAMAFKAEDFVETMNNALDMKLQFDGNKVDATCQAYLNKLRELRGLSSIH
jgi:hypothetical protein